uniref:Uncharacterized protein n=1 Tax=Anopheles stephensi TaxID=30069 RepID=A0A182XXJ2_ANOST
MCRKKRTSSGPHSVQCIEVQGENSRIGSTPDKGVPDMTCISDIDENGINRNLKVRYERDQIYVSFYKTIICHSLAHPPGDFLNLPIPREINHH